MYFVNKIMDNKRIIGLVKFFINIYFIKILIYIKK